MSHGVSRSIDQAPIVHQSEREICFRVDDVKPRTKRLPFANAGKQFAKRLGRPLQAFTHEQASDIVLEKQGIEHGLVRAVYLAFSEHRPLVLTPDVIWMTLAQGFAQHVNNHAEALRSRMVAHTGKLTLDAVTLTLSTSHDWTNVVQQWSVDIQSHLPAELYQLMLCDFSTTTPVIRTASQVVMLDAFQQYFDFALYCICGIPSVTVKGSVQDWIRIRERVDVMAAYHLDWWTDRLKPICDGFIETVRGHPSESFWKHIHSPKEVYGGELITGWLADLFPYIKDPMTATPTIRNPILTIPRTQLTSDCGLSPRKVPTGLSSAPFTLRCGGDPPQKAMELIAGFVGVKQEPDTGRLEPAIGWAVVEEDESSRVFTILASAAVPDEAQQKESTSRTELERYKTCAPLGDPGMPKECVRLMDRYENGQVFFSDTPHPWVLKPLSALSLRQVSSDKFRMCTPAVHFMDLVDGRAIAYVAFSLNRFERSDWLILVGQPDGPAFQCDSVRVIAKGFSQFLRRLTEADGAYYFDAPQFQPEVWL